MSRNAFSPFKGCLVAHRGLHDNTTDHPENTLAAFELASQGGYGIELDIRLSADDQLVVFHDDDLQRLCGVAKTCRELSAAELAQLRVLGTDQGVPLFSDVLALVDGRVPLVVEIKPEIDDALTCRLADAMLRDYGGAYCIESFDPRVLAWYRRHNPAVVRGQLSEDITQDTGSGVRFLDALLARMVFNIVTWPDFVAYNIRDAASPALHWWRRILRCPLVAWTIKSQAQLDKARHSFGAYIFEGFTPDER